MADKPAAPQPVVEETPSPAGPVAPGSPPQSAPPRPRQFSRGGLIAASALTLLCAAVIVNEVVRHAFSGTTLTQYAIANAALFWRAFRPPVRWWQGVLVWVGGILAGSAIGLLVAEPTFEELATGNTTPRYVIFAVGLAVSVLVMWLGFRRGRQPGKAADDHA
jgi:uncharacterized membrane protein YfcA